MKNIHAVLAALVALTASCVTRAQVRNAPPEAGLERVYPAPFDPIKAAVADVLAQAGYGIKEEGWMDRDRWRVLATQGLTTGGLGRIARVVVEDHPTDSRVWILVQSKLETADARTADAGLAADLHGRLCGRLGLPLPAPSAPVETAEGERTYSCSLSRGCEAALQVSTALGYGASTPDTSGNELRTLSVEGADGRRLFVAFYALAEGRTRAVIEVRGAPANENQPAAQEFLNALDKELGPPGAAR